MLVGLMTRMRASQTAQIVSPTPTWTPEPLLPTPTPAPALAEAESTDEQPVELAETEDVIAVATATSLPAETLVPTATPMPEAIVPTSTPIRESRLIPLSSAEIDPPTAGAFTDDQFERVGISGKQWEARGAWDAGLRWTHLLDWLYTRRPMLPDDITYWRTLRVSETGWDYLDSWDVIYEEARKYPGEIWIIGNEPDVRWQDGVTAETYAERYHEAYTKIKGVDPTAQLAIAGVAAGTDLRLRYLDRVLEVYEATYGEPMQVDVWTVHAYVLPEVRDSWGVDIPPGLPDDQGDVYEIADHDDLDIFTDQLINFRRWMAERGFRDKPLAVTEFGVLLPNDYGFPPESVEQYMRDSVTILLTLQDEEIGMPADNNRLVQTMFWFILSDLQYPTGDMWDVENEQLTSLGEAMKTFVGR